MGRIINNNLRPSLQIPLDDLCGEIYQGDYVLVIGDDVILKEGLEGGSNNKQFFDFQVNQYLNEKGIRVETTDDYKDKISEFLKREWTYDVDAEVNEDLVNLLKTQCFRLVITTTCDGYVEAVMRRIWGDELRVINIYDMRDKAVFGSYSEYDLLPPTLVYAMGKADSAVAKFVYTEDNAIELIATRWLESTKRPNDLINYIRNKKVLGIGCKLDDWEFRFFWYSLRQDLSKLHGDVAISLNPETSESDRKLADYLTRKKVQDKGNSRVFLHLLQAQLNDPNQFVYERLRQRLQSGGVFLSYATEDFGMVCHINKYMTEQGCHVWFDNRQLLGGDRYDDRISQAIDECKIFMPILSRQTAEDLQAGRNRYYMKEWEQALQNPRCVLIPVTVPGFEIRELRNLLPEGFRSRTVVEWYKTGPASLLSAIHDKLNQ